MDLQHDDRFLVFVRTDPVQREAPEQNEEPVAACQTYGEARRIKLALHLSAQDCVIRYHGDSGGGD
jgi:hypothetical protein